MPATGKLRGAKRRMPAPMTETDNRPDAAIEWVRVPRVPTEAMIRAFRRPDGHRGGLKSGDFQRGYSAMLAAAPKPPQAPELQEIVGKILRKIGCGPSNEASFCGQYCLCKQEAETILSALAPYLAASADVRRQALEEAAQIVDRYDTHTFAARHIAYDIRARAGSPPSAPQPASP